MDDFDPTPGEKYLPSNGTEGECFFESWCVRCQKDAEMNGSKPFDDCDDDELCDIIARSFRGEVDEWVYGPDGAPTCTAFVPAGSEVPRPRCEHTADMFESTERG